MIKISSLSSQLVVVVFILFFSENNEHWHQHKNVKNKGQKN